MEKVFRILIVLLLWFFAGAAHAWSLLALFYGSFSSSEVLRLLAVILYGGTVFSCIVVSPQKTKMLCVSLLCFLVVLFWFVSMKPPLNRIYPASLVMATVNFNKDAVTIHGVRDCHYRSKDDFDIRYETKNYDLNKLQTLDVLVNYWGMNAVAHTFLSFGFSQGEYIVVSIEIRPEVGETYSMLKGFFKQYELIYIWGEEQDLVALRTNFKNEDVYLYRTNCPPEDIRKLFVIMLQRTQALSETPQFYNTVTHSCTNTIVNDIIAANIARVPWYKRRLLTGDIDRRLYMARTLKTEGKSFRELREESLINARAKAAGQSRDFSDRIRTYLSVY